MRRLVTLFGPKLARLAAFLFTVVLVTACASEAPRYSDDPKRAFKATKAYLSEYATYEDAVQLSTLSAGRIDLGKKMFNDPRLSGNGRVSCATCHNPSEAYTQNSRALPPGATAGSGARNAPSLFDVVSRKTFFYDGRANSLEQQAIEPLVHHREMANVSLEDLANRVRGLDDYDRFFNYAFGAPANVGNIATSLAAFQRTLITGPSRFDLWKYEGRKGLLNGSEIRGYSLFVGKAGCASCHLVGTQSAPLTDDRFHDTGYAATKPAAYVDSDFGRFLISGNPDDKYAFRTPTLRNVALTGPYMHDGRLKTLASVVGFFDTAGQLGLSAREQADLVAFLKSLTSEQRP